MIVLYALNLFALLGLELYRYWFLQKYFRLPLFSPVLIVFIFNFPVFLGTYYLGPIINGLSFFNPYFQFGILMLNLQMIIFVILIVILSKYSAIFGRAYHPFLKYFHIPLTINNVKRFPWVAVFFFILYVTFLTLTAFKHIGILEWVQNPRLSYLHGRAGVGHYYSISITCLTVSSFFAFLYLNPRWHIFLLPLYLYAFYLFGSKGIIMRFAGWYLVILALKISQKQMLIWFPFVLVATMTFSLRHHLGSGFDISFLIEKFSIILRYFDHMVNGTMYYESFFANRIGLFWGEVWTTSWWGVLPRSIFSEKPFVYGTINIVEHFYPGAATAGHTPAFGGAVNAFADFGVIGVILGALFNPVYFITVLCSALVLSLIHI